MIVFNVKENLNHQQEVAASHQQWTGHYNASSIYRINVLNECVLKARVAACNIFVENCFKNLFKALYP